MMHCQQYRALRFLCSLILHGAMEEISENIKCPLTSRRPSDCKIPQWDTVQVMLALLYQHRRTAVGLGWPCIVAWRNVAFLIFLNCRLCFENLSLKTRNMYSLLCTAFGWHVMHSESIIQESLEDAQVARVAQPKQTFWPVELVF